jgi:hypothetical protein
MSLTEDEEIDKTPPAVTSVAAAGASEEEKVKDNPKKPEKTVTIEVDEIPVVTPKDTTPREVLIAAGKDPAKRQLVRVQGKHQEPFPDPDQVIHVHEGEQFVTTSTGNTTVS